jgi:hypothetical protein
MGRKKKSGTGRWRRTFRKINGRKRAVKVRRKADGTEQVKLLYPKK